MNFLVSNGYLIKVGSETFIETNKLKELFVTKSDASSLEAKEVLDYLNLKLKEEYPNKKGFLATDSNLKFINGRLNECYTVEDLKSVIDTMISKWKGTNMEMYLRPETLFNATKFQTYINNVEDCSSDDWTKLKV